VNKPKLADVGELALSAVFVTLVFMVAVFYVFPSRHLNPWVAALATAILVGCGVFVSQLMFTRGSSKRTLSRAVGATFITFAATLALFYPSHGGRAKAALAVILILDGVLTWQLVSTRRGSK
jgi:O-antigen/teichoic acid export membrane protein